MKDQFNIYDDASLLRKLLTDDDGMTEEERLMAEQLLAEHPHLRKEYEKLRREHVLQEEFERYNKYSSRDAYYRFINKVCSSTTAPVHHRSLRIWYSAAAVAILLIGAFAVWKMVPSQQLPEEALTILRPGIQKGQIVMPGGKTMMVGANNMNVVVGGVRVTYRQGLLSYAPVHVNLGDTTNINHQLNKFVIPRGGENTVLLADGTTVHLNAASELIFPMQFTGDRRMVELKGEAYFDVKKDAEHPFIVKTKYGNVQVLGTAFNVNAYDDRQRCEVTLVRGKVRFTNSYHESVILEPGEQAVAMDNLLHKHEVDVDDYISWTKGIYNFHNESLSNIMSTFAKWYDVDIVYENNDIPDLTYTGTVRRYDTMNAFLDVFEMTGDLSYRVVGRKVYFSKRE
jgi:ferric-dicitrate binding protein FerR (iron transport regulator)